MTGTLALVGSGEYLPVMEPVERALLAGRPPRYVQLATAAAPEGPDTLARWHALGREQAERLGVEQVVVDVRTRDDADDPKLAALIRGAGLVYLSGGSPGYLARTLRSTAVWAAIEQEWRAGASLAGCSAGAMALTGWVPPVREPGADVDPGLALLPGLRVLPHFDVLDRAVPGLTDGALAGVPAGHVVLGIDEDTALVGGPHEWTVRGRQSVWSVTPTGRVEHRAGATLRLQLREARPASSRAIGTRNGEHET